MTGKEVVEILKRNQRDMSGPKYAKSLGVSVGYLSDVFHGRRDPGPALLKHLGLVRVTTIRYEQITESNNGND